MSKQNNNRLTIHILIGLVAGISTGILVNYLNTTALVDVHFINLVLSGIQNSLAIIGQLFLNAMRMLVIPIIFFSLISGTANLANPKKLGGIGAKTLLLFVGTTGVAILMAIGIANFVNVGSSLDLSSTVATDIDVEHSAGSIKDIIVNILPSNPIAAMAQGEILPLILFSMLMGLAVALCGEKTARLKVLFNEFFLVTMQLFGLILKVIPIGVFALLATHFIENGIESFGPLVGFALTTFFVLGLFVFLFDGLLLYFMTKLNPIIFFKKITSVMLFAFSTSSSNASIPVVLDTAENKLGVHNSIASFVVPLGATLNMNGTAIMQGVAVVLIANMYGVELGFAEYAMVVITATLAAIGTAGVPGVGVITLALILQQAGLPLEGIGMIMAVERIIDMARTVVNITGDMVTSVIVAKSEGVLDEDVYNRMDT